ncbi:unnamed protein product [Withania somnifera]
MESLSSVSPSIVLPPGKLYRHHRRRFSGFSSHAKNPKPYPQFRISILNRSSISRMRICCKLSSSGSGGAGDEEKDEEEKESFDEVERALRMDGTIPGTSNKFVQQVSSRAYDMRRHLQQTFESSSYDVLEANPWRETPKPVYVLTQRENQLCTMKTRRNRSEVEKELGMLFSKRGKWQNRAKQPEADTRFQMLVEDIREGVLVFEDEDEAAKYCDLLQGGGQGCEGVAEIEASSVFDICRKMRALAVLFRRGRTPPLPESLKLNLRARKRSLEDQENLM